jgi:hypothetical protein
MKKQILAVIGGIALVAAFMVLSMSNNAFAQVTSESRVLQAILGLTEHLKWHTEELVDTTENIEEDLLFKKKFWQLRFNTTDLPEGWVTSGNAAAGTFLIAVVGGCEFADEAACAYNMESIQLIDNGTSASVGAIAVGNATTNISGKNITTPTNLLVDTGIGKIGIRGGGSGLIGDFLLGFGVLEGGVFQPSPFSGIVELNGEKPQGMDICVFSFYVETGGALSPGCLIGIGSQQSFIEEQLSLAQQLIP